MKNKPPREPKEVIERVLTSEKLDHKAFGRVVNELAQPIRSGVLDWQCLLRLTESTNALARTVRISALSLLDFERYELNSELKRLTDDEDQDVSKHARQACELIKFRYKERGLGDPWNGT